MRKTLLTGSLVLVALFSQAQADVRDNAGFFTPNAVERADQLISQMKQKAGTDLVVETLPAIPDDQRAQLDALGTNRFFQQYTARRAQLAGINGVYVLITREPSHLQIVEGDRTRQVAFNDANRDQLRDTLVSNFKAKNYDQGLLDGVTYVNRTVLAAAQSRTPGAATNSPTLQTFPGTAAPTNAPRTSTPAPTVPQRSTGHSMFFWLIVIGGGLFLLMFVLRRLASRAMSSGSGYGAYNQQTPPPVPGNQYPQPGYGNSYPGTSGGGFGRGLLGGLLGGAAGGWLYNRATHPHNTAQGSPNFPGQSIPQSPSSPDLYGSTPDRDFSASSGGAFGGGGGDFGGGADFSGGDAGGGSDSSGGGDF